MLFLHEIKDYIRVFMFSVNNFRVLYALYECKTDMYNLSKQVRHYCCTVIVTVALKKRIMYYELTNLLQRLRTLTSLRNAMTLSRSGDCKLRALEAAYSSLFTLCQRLVSATSRSVLRREEHLELVLEMGSQPTRLSPTSPYG